MRIFQTETSTPAAGDHDENISEVKKATERLSRVLILHDMDDHTGVYALTANTLDKTVLLSKQTSSNLIKTWACQILFNLTNKLFKNSCPGLLKNDRSIANMSSLFE